MLARLRSPVSHHVNGNKEGVAMDDDMFGRFLELHRQRIFGFAQRLVHDDDVAQDVTQRTCLNAWRYRDGFNRITESSLRQCLTPGHRFGPFCAWLFGAYGTRKGVAWGALFAELRSRGKYVSFENAFGNLFDEEEIPSSQEYSSRYPKSRKDPELRKADQILESEVRIHGRSNFYSDPLDWINAVMDERRLYRCLDQLPLRQQGMLFMKYHLDLQGQEIASVFQCSDANVTQQIERALERLQECLDQSQAD